MKQLDTIQKREKLNNIYSLDEKDIISGANHEYIISFNDNIESKDIVNITFQNGPRKESDSVRGIIDTDLLEIVRDRLKGFQQGEFNTIENDFALKHIEMALIWMNKRVEDRIERNVLGTNNK